MTQIEVFDEIAVSVSDEAASRGCSKAELASFLLQQGLAMQRDGELSVEEETILLRRMSDEDGRAFMTNDEVDARFEALFTELRAR